jgi:hypothetical protein
LLFLSLLLQNQNFTISSSVTDLGDAGTKLPHTQAVHLAKVLSTSNVPLVTLNLTGKREGEREVSRKSTK